MKRLKKFYRNNRIYCILMLISLVCLVLIICSVIFYFIHQSLSSVCGDRLNEVSEHPVTSELSSMEDYFKKQSIVTNVSVRLQGKIIYVDFSASSSATNDDINNICTDSLSLLTDDQKSFYDVQFIVTRDNLNPYLGSKSASSTVISWGNYTYETTTAAQ